MSNNKKSSIDVLWNAIPDEVKLNMPFGTYEIVSKMHNEEIIESINYFKLRPYSDLDAQQYYNQTFGGDK